MLASNTPTASWPSPDSNRKIQPITLLFPPNNVIDIWSEIKPCLLLTGSCHNNTQRLCNIQPTIKLALIIVATAAIAIVAVISINIILAIHSCGTNRGCLVQHRHHCTFRHLQYLRIRHRLH